MASLPQQSLDLVVTLQTRMNVAGQLGDTKQNWADLLSAVQLLAQNALSATPSTNNPDPSAVAIDVATSSPVSDPPAGT